MGRGRANSSTVRPRKRLTVARLMESGREVCASFAASSPTRSGVAAAGVGVEADCGAMFSTTPTRVEAAESTNFSCMAMMANLTPAGVIPCATAISVYVFSVGSEGGERRGSFQWSGGRR